METSKFLQNIKDILTQYLNGKMSGKSMVSIYDDLMADEFPDKINPSINKILNKFHVEFALFEANEKWRSEDPALYGTDKLYENVVMLVGKLRDSQ